MKAELEQLITLQLTDTEIRRLQSELNAIPLRRAEIEKEFDQRAFEFKEIEERRDGARERRAQIEREMAETKTRADKAERDLRSSTNAKIYEAAIRETDAAKKQMSQLETTMLEQMEIFEQAERDIGERAPEIEKLRGEMDARFKIFEEETRAQGARVEELRAERERLAASLPKNLAAMYNRINARIRDGVAVAEARNNSCTACRMSLRPQVMTEIRRGEDIIICDNCNRILYYRGASQHAQAAS